MNQSKLEVVKQKMARVNVDHLGISELKWTGMGEFNSDDHYIYYCEQESIRRNGIAIMVKKRIRNAVLGCNLKNYTGWMHETSARTWCIGKTQRDRVEREGGGGIGMGNTC